MVRRFALALVGSVILSFVAAATLGAAMEPPQLKTIATVVAYAHPHQ